MESLHNFSGNVRFPKPTDTSMLRTDEYCKEYFSKLPKVTSLNFHTDLDKVPFEPTSAAGIGFEGKKGENNNHAHAINRAYATIKNAQRHGITHVIDNSTPDAAYTRTQLTELSHGLKIR